MRPEQSTDDILLAKSKAEMREMWGGCKSSYTQEWIDQHRERRRHAHALSRGRHEVDQQHAEGSDYDDLEHRPFPMATWGFSMTTTAIRCRWYGQQRQDTFNYTRTNKDDAALVNELFWTTQVVWGTWRGTTRR